MKNYYVYILASQKNGTLYVGMTSNIFRRIYEHQNESLKGFTRKYAVKKLVYYEVFEDVEQAILYEKKLKKWRREWKIDLIVKNNPEWKDLY
ncbi:MAG: GIY-YIG nuclease family protein [Alphaproteobacteria bacterium]